MPSSSSSSPKKSALGPILLAWPKASATIAAHGAVGSAAVNWEGGKGGKIARRELGPHVKAMAYRTNAQSAHGSVLANIVLHRLGRLP